MNNDSQEFAQYKAQLVKELVKKIPLPEQMIICDVGCGDGYMTKYMQELFFASRVIGYDWHKDAIDTAKEQNPNIEFQYINNFQALPKNNAHLVIASLVLHHIKPQEQEKFVDALMEALKPNGLLVILELNPYRPDILLLRYTDLEEKNAHFVSPITIRSRLSKYGIFKIRFYNFFPRMLNFLFFLESYISWIPFGRLYAAYMQKNLRSQPQ